MSPQIQNGARPSTMAGAAQTPWDDAVWDPSGRSPQSQCSGDARADMALARADTPARNQLKLNSFLALVYQEPGGRRRRPPPTATSPARCRSASRGARRAADGRCPEPPLATDVARSVARWNPSGGPSRCGALIRTAQGPHQCFSRSCKRTWHTRRRSIDNRARRAALARHAY